MWDNRGRKAIKQNLYKERVAEGGYNCGRENTIPYERFSHCIHALLAVSATIPACPQALSDVVRSSDFELHTESKSYVHMQDLSVLFFTTNIVFSFYLISP